MFSRSVRVGCPIGYLVLCRTPVVAGGLTEAVREGGVFGPYFGLSLAHRDAIELQVKHQVDQGAIQ